MALKMYQADIWPASSFPGNPPGLSLYCDKTSDMLLGFPRCAGVVVKIGNVMAGLVALVVQMAGKEAVQPGDEPLAPAKHADEARHILRHEEGVLPGDSFRDVEGRLAGVKRFYPVSIGVPAPRKSLVRIDHVAPEL